MKSKFFIYGIVVITFLVFGCKTNTKKENKITSSPAPIEKEILPDKLIRNQEINILEDTPVNDYLKEMLKPVRENFKKINSIKKWSEVKTNDLWESTEGGEAKYFYHQQQLIKITTKHFGETGQKITEYYLLNGKLSFVFERLYKYNGPLHSDSISMMQNNDTDFFDFAKSEIIDDRSYFENNKLIHQVNSQDCGSPFTQDYLLEEEKRINTEFNKLTRITKR